VKKIAKVVDHMHAEVSKDKIFMPDSSVQSFSLLHCPGWPLIVRKRLERIPLVVVGVVVIGRRCVPFIGG
jgi:hypothetical protein